MLFRYNLTLIKMRLSRKLFISLFSLMAYIFFPAQSSYANTPCKPVGLICEYLVNPIGIDEPHPRLSWHLEDMRRGARQTAYRIYVSTDSLEVSRGKGNQWESGKINSEISLVNYHGKPLQPFTKYYWTVEVWDKDNKQSIQSRIASFETGMISIKNWQGSWITDIKDINKKPAPYFRKTFATTKKIRSARAYIAVAGLYELYVNGKKIGNQRLDPMFTRYDRRTLYVAHDVTAQITSGQNAIGVLLGNGWYNHQSTAVWDFHKAPWRARPSFCLDLLITYDDNSVETITSDKNWKTSTGPLIFNSIYTGEHYDARLEQPGWNTTDFDDSKWQKVIYTTAPSQNMVAQALHSIRNTEEIIPKTFKKINDTTYIFDLGRNIAGVSQIKVKGEPGTIIRLKHGEKLSTNGLVDQSNIDLHYRPTDNTDPFQKDIFILSGKGDEIFMPRFNYKGFQYVEVTSTKPVNLTDKSLKGYFMHSDVPVSGRISSSNPTLNKIWRATNNSYLSNLFGYPTDCPQREKNGWTGDAHIAIETGLYNFDGITVYEKWLADHRDEQQPNGVLPSIIPTGGWGYEWGNGPDWTSTIAIIPWNIYMFYGDTTILSDNYDNIQLYVDHINQISPTGLTSWGLGDWVPVKSKTPVELTSSIYYFVDVTILANIAQVLGKKPAYKRYSALAEKIRKAINAKYLNKETSIYGSGFQTELSAALFWGLVPPELKSKVADNLAKRVAADNYHLDVGLLGTKTILNALSENGYADMAYKIASRETFPSWGWWIVNGATTLYENWDIEAQKDISLNHIMFGEIGAWFYKALGGIKPDPASPGFKNILLEPNFVSGLEKFEATYKSTYGTITSSWKRSAGKIAYSITIPANTSATLRLHINKGEKVYENGKLFLSPSEKSLDLAASDELKVYKLPAGTYRFELR